MAVMLHALMVLPRATRVGHDLQSIINVNGFMYVKPDHGFVLHS